MATVAAASRRPWLTRSRKEALWFYVFIAPWVVGFLAFLAGPIAASAYLSLTSYDIIHPPSFIGLQNYSDLFADDLFWQSLKVTTIYSLFSVPLGIALALSVAVMLNQKIPFVALFRTIYYLPSVISGVAVSLLWLWMFNPSFGLLNSILWQVFHIRGPGWIYSEQWVLPSLIFMSLWTVGGSIVLYLAGLQGVPTELYEAASLDGAGAWRRFWHVTLPMISPVILFTLITGIIASFQTFTQAQIMTQGGPHYGSWFYIYNLWYNAFGSSGADMGYASAIAWILFILVLALTLLALRTSQAWVYYEGAERR
ncbi:MAG TPA: sugar ABC transporter permease [Chloroflexota bacterium]|nr:sugar ABC transporter permease [Chloroflexota bacterium]